MTETTPSAAAPMIVIGAGIVGVMTALELQRRGKPVLLVDREGPAAGCSYGNGGAIGPNTCTPFAMPGILRRIPKWYLDPDGPVTVSPSWALRSVPWILRWILGSREAAATASARGMRFLHAGCLDAYRAALGPELAAGLLREDGYLYLYEGDQQGRGELAAAAIREALGVPSEVLDAARIRELEPDLAGIFRRGLKLPGNGHTVNPKRLVDTLFGIFQRRGGRFLRSEVLGFELRDGRVVALRTGDGQVAAGGVALCAGIGSGGLAAELGARLPLVAERGYHVVFGESDVRLNHKIMNGTRGFGATGMEMGLQVTGTVELDSPGTAPNWRRAEALARGARQMFRAGALGPVSSRWMGNRPSLPDSLPVIDRAPRAANAVLAFGHSHWGLSGAPRTGVLAADLLAGREAPPELRPFRASRF
ncbi:MAG: FAD-dependent oxidoreductase [Rhodobacteraceae bacterium]|nr:FAD-dependent oxidoreductase [Paracoccaceae bacterium]